MLDQANKAEEDNEYEDISRLEKMAIVKDIGENNFLREIGNHNLSCVT